jgi:hypothetical protein
MPHTPQPGMQGDQPLEFGFGAIGRTVIDVDDLERPLAFERRGDFADERRNVVRLVAHRHDDGNRRFLQCHGVVRRPLRPPASGSVLVSQKVTSNCFDPLGGRAGILMQNTVRTD